MVTWATWVTVYPPPLAELDDAVEEESLEAGELELLDDDTEEDEDAEDEDPDELVVPEVEETAKPTAGDPF